MINKSQEFDIERIRKLINNEKYIRNCKIDIKEIKKIYDDYSTNYHSGSINNTKNEILNKINDELPISIHSIRGRVKDPDHLIEKIYRNAAKNEEKYGSINVDNYNKLITDIIGVRIIILDKRNWKDVHDFLLNLFQNDPTKYIIKPLDLVANYDKYGDKENSTGCICYHAEKPIVYIRSEDDRSIYQDANLKIDTSKRSYRSIHYIIRYNNYYFEIQVRTLFEEGWLEFDHKIKYPYDNDNPKKKEYADILNSLAQTADKLISFYEEEDFKKSSNEIINVSEEVIEESKRTSLREKLIDLF